MSAPGATPARGARVLVIPPPLYYVVGFVAGMLIPFRIPTLPGTAILGAVILAIGTTLALGGIVAVVRHRTTIVPHRVVSSLVTTGAYRLSRNPMYTGLAIAYVGGALLVESWWSLVLLPLVLYAVLRLVIDPEERYLAAAFDEAYEAYRVRVRRWL